MRGTKFELTLAEFTGEETRRAIEVSSMEVVHELARRAAHHAGAALWPYAAPWAGSWVVEGGRVSILYRCIDEGGEIIP